MWTIPFFIVTPYIFHTAWWLWTTNCEDVAVATDYFKVQSQHLFGALTRTTENLNQKYVLSTTG
jgi:hypothetical protein